MDGLRASVVVTIAAGSYGVISCGGVASSRSECSVESCGPLIVPPIEPPTNTCPDAAPTDNNACNYAGSECQYNFNGCNYMTFASCVGGRWKIEQRYGLCNPPFPQAPQCPPVLPSAGPCSPQDGLGCTYPDDCGMAVASCTAGTWQVTRPECGMGGEQGAGGEANVGGEPGAGGAAGEGGFGGSP